MSNVPPDIRSDAIVANAMMREGAESLVDTAQNYVRALGEEVAPAVLSAQLRSTRHYTEDQLTALVAHFAVEAAKGRA